jgi:hypothetical protein
VAFSASAVRDGYRSPHQRGGLKAIPGQILDLTASVDVELSEHFAEVVVAGVRAEEQLCGDLVVG